MKQRLKILLAANAALAALTGLAFVNNVTVVARWRSAFKAANGDATLIPRHIQGALPFLDWTAVDYSCVTTLIPFMGFLLLAIAAHRALRGHRPSDECFPFFRSYDQMNVALGLIGTLWGIIMIGYYDMETVTMASLMSCLHTALFSTLAAVVWVFIVVHPILIPLARAAMGGEGFAPEDDDRDLEEALDDLRAAARDVGAVLDGQREAAARFAASVDNASRGIDGFSSSLSSATARTLEAMSKSLDSAVDRIGKSIAAMEAAQADRERRFDEILDRRIARLSQESAENAARAEKAEAALARIRAAIQP